MIAGLCRWSTAGQCQNGTPKVARKAFNIGEVWNPPRCHGNKLVKLLLKSKSSRISLPESNISDTNWPRYLSSSFDQNLVEFMTLSLG